MAKLACSKIVLPDRSILLRQKLVENAKTNKNTKNGETFVENENEFV